MSRIVEWIQSFAMAIGGPGLFVIAFLDSSVLSLPEINDILIVWMVTQHKHRMVYYASMATLGSIAGCLLLYEIGKRGGEAFLLKRFHERHVDRALALYRKYGVMAVLVPAILPPPAPFKIFVLLAGVARMKPLHFVLAIAGGRGLRYFAEGWLAIRYGDQAIEYIRENGAIVSVALAVLVLVAGAGWFIAKRVRQP
jgi:membrane protein YqaA with SNARE-associated domain